MRSVFFSALGLLLSERKGKYVVSAQTCPTQLLPVSDVFGFSEVGVIIFEIITVIKVSS